MLVASLQCECLTVALITFQPKATVTVKFLSYLNFRHFSEYFTKKFKIFHGAVLEKIEILGSKIEFLPFYGKNCIALL